MVIRNVSLTLMCIIFTLLTSCAPVIYKHYEGNSLKPEEIVVLKSPHKFNNDIYIVSLDGKPGKYGSIWKNRYRIELLPGRHTLTVRYKETDLVPVRNQTLTFTGEAGKIYTIKYSADISLESMSIDAKAWVEEIKEE